MTNDTLSRAFDLTRAMQSAADARDWVRVAALVDERSPLLMNLSGEQTPEALDRVRQIMAIDASITAALRTSIGAPEVVRAWRSMKLRMKLVSRPNGGRNSAPPFHRPTSNTAFW